MSAALRIQLMLLARNGHFDKKSAFSDLTSLHCHPRAQHSTGALHIEHIPALSPGDTVANSEGCGENETCD